MTFRIKGKRFGLTYSQCDLDRQVIYDGLSSLGRDVVRCRIGYELHADGGHHRHVAIEFAKAWDRRSTTLFDIQGFHPNIKAKRTKPEWAAAWIYAAKDGDYQDWGAPQEEGAEEHSFAIGNPDFDEEAAVREAESYTGYLRLCRLNGIPAAYANAHWNRGADTTITDENINEYLRGREITNDTLRELQFDAELAARKSYVLSGPTAIGKTTWAIMHMPKPALWVTDVDALKKLRHGYHKSIIFDDIQFQHVPRTAQLHIADVIDGRHIRTRYINAFIPAGIYKCFTCNPGHEPFIYDSAINRRLYEVKC